MTAANFPSSTYRVQFNKDFRFIDCRDIVPYLHMLGIGALYSSPRFRARRGSEHGYDVASPLRVNSELGTEEEFNDLCMKLRHYGLGLVLDIVPNHMAASHENPWWMDVLENGPSSPYAHYFDIEWHPFISKAAVLQNNKVLLPILGDLYGNVLEQGLIAIGLDENGFFLRYYEHKIPLDPASYGHVLDACLDRIRRDLGEQHASIAELERLREEVRRIPSGTDLARENIILRLDQGRMVKRPIFVLYRDNLQARPAIESALREMSQNPERMHLLLEQQAYRLAYWKIALEEINYRRFFDINELVCIRVEAEDVFAARHQIIFQLIAEGKVTGLRVDHIDGLYDPEAYLMQLEEAVEDAAQRKPFYVAVEKILGRDEPMPRKWKTFGTTGYDFLNALNELFLDPAGLATMEAAYARFTGKDESFDQVCYECKKLVMLELFAAEVQALGHQLGSLAAQDWKARDVPLSELIRAMVEVSARLSVYRTYIRNAQVSRRDSVYLKQALDLARETTADSDIGDPAFRFLRRVLFLEPSALSAELHAEYLRFVMRWQQFTGPVMAKGLEDTAGYVHNSVLSRNEVGSDAARSVLPGGLSEFHRLQKERRLHWPHSMSATSTHDTKRSEDVRARLNVLSEVANEWEKSLSRWSAWNKSLHTEVRGVSVPTPSEETMLYQTMLGAWPLEDDAEPEFLERVQTFLGKAVREAKVHSSWIRPDEAHEQALAHFLQGAFGADATAFRKDFFRLQHRIAWYGMLNALSQVLLKITSPGVPDFYQGCELWDLSMVDPDNRRPVDFRRRIQLLEEVRRAHSEKPRLLLRQILANWKDGRAKLYLTDRALECRIAHATVYRDGEYTPLQAFGRLHTNVCAFARHLEQRWCITVAPRLYTQIARAGRMPLGKSAWQDTTLPLPAAAPDAWQDALTGAKLSTIEGPDGARHLTLADVFKYFPVALLVGTVRK
ncbi:MAG TPA: malto-oligosyltrehalose synthase [Terracidiphilus sp.]|nr:malto-oligosyltrehalose synthase [Terracidiphilus sp.]